LKQHTEEAKQLAEMPLIVFLVREDHRLEQATIGVISAGYYKTAIIDALYQRGHRKIITCRRDLQDLTRLEEKFPEIVTSTEDKIVANYSDILILAIKSQFVKWTSKKIRDYSKNKLVISLGCAKPISKIERLLPYSRIARVTTGIFVDESIAAYALGQRCGLLEKETIKYIFGHKSLEVEEKGIEIGLYNYSL